MKVLSWNILAHEWIDPADYPGIDADILLNRAERFKTIRKHITAIDPDVMLLQEVMQNEYRKLARRFGGEYHISKLHRSRWQVNVARAGSCPCSEKAYSAISFRTLSNLD